MSSISKELFYERLGRVPGDFSVERREQDVVHDKKWFVFLRRVSVFRYIPFIDFVFGAGSMALGNVNSSSDFDVLIGAKHGRIFTVRFLSLFFTSVLGIRRGKGFSKLQSNDLLCMNHFVTEKSYRLSEPYNLYWQELYRNLVPLYGKREVLDKFYEANDWVLDLKYREDVRHMYEDKGRVALFLEWVLGGWIGDMFEYLLRLLFSLKFYKLNHNEVSFKSRMIFSDKEMEFHPDTRRIEELING